ncbi:MAG: serine/threonine-protein kinase RsbW [Pyrinomonadaceae bacterium]|jgi:serine/threonine-protein kinase RsbW|nr:serine/threonine-protein kinase RsbW [Pyrinomonadaceae bacterium]
MSTDNLFKAAPAKRILGRIAPENFIGRSEALSEIAALAPSTSPRRGLLVHAAPAAGASELLRQAYDKLFRQRGGASPIYFAFTRHEQTIAAAARRFLHTFLSQLVAHRRGDHSFVNAPPALRDLIDLADPSDYEWVERLVLTYERAREGSDELALVRLCFSAPVLAAARGARTVVMLDEIQNIEKLRGEVELGNEIAQVSMHGDVPFVLCGLRRGLLDELSGGNAPHRFDGFGTIHLEGLKEADARTLVERLAFTERVAINDETRDLVVQLFGGSPFYIASFMYAAHRDQLSLTSFLECQKIYVDEILGGRINRRFNSILEEITPSHTTRRALIRLLHEAATNAGGKSPVEAWRRRLELEPDELYPLMFALHVRELASFNATFMEIGTESLWRDYLRASYRLQVTVEPRALVVADTLVETLKRAPQTMARHYRRAAALNLRELLARFDAQRVAASLLHYDRFSRIYRGVETEEIEIGLDAETDLIRLPQVVHAASCASFHPPMLLVGDEERCAVAHGFDAMPYTDANEIVWLTAEIDSKLEAGRAVTEVWCDRLTQVGHSCGFKRFKLWLVAPEGFSAEASDLLSERDAFSSSRKQLELLTARLSPEAAEVGATGADAPDEFEMVIPMGSDTELIAAHTVEQIARRLDFPAEAINQIKTALIEACINAAEHSLSPDRKIYQRFRLESDKLVVTVSSRGLIVPSPTNAGTNGSDAREENNGRRGWGLKLIRTLMDEVEFERVDDGTRLRMTKYLRR